MMLMLMTKALSTWPKALQSYIGSQPWQLHILFSCHCLWPLSWSNRLTLLSLPAAITNFFLLSNSSFASSAGWSHCTILLPRSQFSFV